jgi:hypothetical protein
MRVIPLRKRDATLLKAQNPNNFSIFSIDHLGFCPKNETRLICQIRLFGSQRCLHGTPSFPPSIWGCAPLLPGWRCCPGPAGGNRQALPFSRIRATRAVALLRAPAKPTLDAAARDQPRRGSERIDRPVSSRRVGAGNENAAMDRRGWAGLCQSKGTKTVVCLLSSNLLTT